MKDRLIDFLEELTVNPCDPALDFSYMSAVLNFISPDLERNEYIELYDRYVRPVRQRMIAESVMPINENVGDLYKIKNRLNVLVDNYVYTASRWEVAFKSDADLYRNDRACYLSARMSRLRSEMLDLLIGFFGYKRLSGNVFKKDDE